MLMCAQDFESLRGQWMMDKDGYVFVYSMDSRISLHVRRRYRPHTPSYPIFNVLVYVQL